MEALYARITRFNKDYYEGSRGPGRITKTVVALEDPASKPIKYCRAERRIKGLRLCDELIEQVEFVIAQNLVDFEQLIAKRRVKIEKSQHINLAF